MDEMDRKLEFLKGIMQMIVDCIKVEKDPEHIEETNLRLNPKLLNLKRKTKYITAFLQSVRGEYFLF